MINYHLLWLIPSLIFSVGSFLPLSKSQHWIFRFFDFIRLQLLVILISLLILGSFLQLNNPSLKAAGLLLLLIAIAYNLFILYPYFSLSRKKRKISPNGVSILSMNVMQSNKNHQLVIQTINKIKPDILLTMETDTNWEEALTEIENDYTHSVKVAKSNRYGMHVYTKLKLLDYKVHYLISREHPSIEVKLLDKEDNEFVFWAIHPPPPSPTEKPTSKQKDGELMMLAKLIRKTELPVITAGDYNNVCWSKISKLFMEITNLKNARIGKGFNSTFPADWPLLRFPIDLLFHSTNIFVEDIKVLAYVGSDHLPLHSHFRILDKDLNPKTKLDSELKNKMNRKIKQGKKAAIVENDESVNPEE